MVKTGKKYKTIGNMKAALLQKGVPLPTKRLTKAQYESLCQEHCPSDEVTSYMDTTTLANTSTNTDVANSRQATHNYGTRRAAQTLQNLDSITQGILTNLDPTMVGSCDPQLSQGGRQRGTLSQHSSPGLTQSTAAASGLAGQPSQWALSPVSCVPVSSHTQGVVTTHPNPTVSCAPVSSHTQSGVSLSMQPDTSALLLSSLQAIQSRLDKLEQQNISAPPAASSGQQPGQPQAGTGSWFVDTQGSRPNQLTEPSQYNLYTAQAGMTSSNNNTNIPGYTQLSTFGAASDALPQVEIVSANVQKEILAGKDINLASLLIPGANFATLDLQGRHAMFGDVLIPLKPDKRLSKILTIQEFITAFSVFRNIMCQTFPHRRPELDSYLRDIIDMSSRFGGTLFYEYHKSFSARAAALLQSYNIKVDWSLRDTRMYTTIFSGCRANSCTVCRSMTHTTDFCPLTAYANNVNQNNQKGFNGSKSGGNYQTNKPASVQNSVVDAQGRLRVRFQGKEICNNFNGETGCLRFQCGMSHACLICKSPAHPAHKCAKSESQLNSHANNKINANKSKNPQ